ncbi:MAG: radical SAM family heme chaperone HemW [Parvularculaceae bacterium]|nr:radical SAM family heme chaperone HemW [Parvularculaceae bacterium]
MRPLGLYVHWPYCAKICPYCDFTVARHREVDAAAWAQALCDDLEFLANRAERRPLVSIYFGGGTPSLMPFSVAEAVMTKAEALFGVEPGAEVTFEANPGDEGRFADFRSLGFNRLSLGVQSFDDQELRYLGRNHDGQQARVAVDAALAAFDRVSLDFIYALPDQSAAVWRQRLLEALSSGAGHLSLYQLTIEPATAFGKAAARGELLPMPDDNAADMYELTQDVTGEAGFPAYEVSNHARSGEEAVHNRLYWDDTDWLAVGPGAHGRLGAAAARVATEGVPKVSSYTALSVGERVLVEPLSPEQHYLEVLASGLRPVEGLRLRRLGEHALALLQVAEPWIHDGLLTHENGRLAATQAGRLVLDHLASALAEAVSSSDAEL